MSRSCYDRHHRLQSPSRDGSRALLSPKIGDFRDDENLRFSNHAPRSPLGVAFGAARRQRAVARWRHRPLRCLLRRASPHRETTSPEPPFAPLTGIAAAPLSPTHPHRNHRETVRAACGSGLPGCDSRGPARDAHGTAASRLPSLVGGLPRNTGRRSGLPAVAGCRAATPDVPLARLAGPAPHRGNPPTPSRGRSRAAGPLAARADPLAARADR